MQGYISEFCNDRNILIMLNATGMVIIIYIMYNNCSFISILNLQLILKFTAYERKISSMKKPGQYKLHSTMINEYNTI